MNAKQKLKELPGLLLFLIIISGVIALILGWKCMAQTNSNDDIFLVLNFRLWLAVTSILLLLRLIVKRIIAAMDTKD